MNIVFINEYYYVKIYNNNKEVRLYQLYGLGNNLICESYNRDAFLLKCNKYVKLNNNIECLIASY